MKIVKLEAYDKWHFKIKDNIALKKIEKLEQKQKEKRYISTVDQYILKQ